MNTYIQIFCWRFPSENIGDKGWSFKGFLDLLICKKYRTCFAFHLLLVDVNEHFAMVVPMLPSWYDIRQITNRPATPQYRRRRWDSLSHTLTGMFFNGGIRTTRMRVRIAELFQSAIYYRIAMSFLLEVVRWSKSIEQLETFLSVSLIVGRSNHINPHLYDSKNYKYK